ncbi:hypothetical protein [Jiangella anatolica]|uniref:Uncharacterized protein n=1 Tax=Jiangella anatolica TaxID=2670374 RepID=A0A2W2BL33_9ACTN|nr:hypothetical protein [Jiangella anatolica]PZF86030.1 hypothetical protein C1I92_02225 [Jiangella anatolica]
MPTFEDPVADAFEAREALRGLAYATRNAPDRIAAYQVLESLQWATSALQTSLEQLSDAYRGYVGTTTLVGGDAVAGAAESRKIANRLRKAARHARHVAAEVTEAWDLDGHTDYTAAPPAGRTAWQLPAPPPPPPPSEQPSARPARGPRSRPGPADNGGLDL